MVVDVLVHQLAPLRAAQLPKECVSLRRGGGRASLDEAIDQAEETGPLLREIPLAGNDEGRISWGVLPERLLAESGSAHERSQDLSDDLLLHRPVAGPGFQCLCA